MSGDNTYDLEGGCAFPFTTQGVGGETNEVDAGMTLRDYFAAQAMQGMLAGYWANSELGGLSHKSFASEAYQYADAMISEGKK